MHSRSSWMRTSRTPGLLDASGTNGSRKQRCRTAHWQWHGWKGAVEHVLHLFIRDSAKKKETFLAAWSFDSRGNIRPSSPLKTVRVDRLVDCTSVHVGGKRKGKKGREACSHRGENWRDRHQRLHRREHHGVTVSRRLPTKGSQFASSRAGQSNRQFPSELG